jgi:phosphoadenosine phosphosulfate reductase
MNIKELQAIEIIRTAWRIFKPPKIAVACSFGKDSMVVLHLCLKVCPNFPVFFVKTPFMPKETLEFRDKIVKDWKLNFAEYASPADFTVPYDLHFTDPDKCCYLLKVLPTKEAVKNLDAWVTGLRSSEGLLRENYAIIEHTAGDLIKVNPILPWNESDIWRYIAIHRIPVHPWYELGHRSLGCACCTTIGLPNESERAGRWRGTSKQGGECGIHTKPLKE